SFPHHDTAISILPALSLHDALPIFFVFGSVARGEAQGDSDLDLALIVESVARKRALERELTTTIADKAASLGIRFSPYVLTRGRSEEHTSELQSHLNLVCRLLLDNK